MKLTILALLAAAAALAQEWRPLFNGKNLDGWEVKGDGQWRVLAGGILYAYPVSGPKNPFGEGWPVTIDEKKYMDWRQTQSWLYTVAEFGEFDLHVEYLTTVGGNSGISLRDHTRGKYSYGPNPDFKRTPAHNGYEIQIYCGLKSKWPSGSIYTFTPAEDGHEKPNDWNAIEVESRNDVIRVKLNGHLAASHPGDPARPKTGPIGLQLHDRFSTMMFRNIRIREHKK
ncbi:MAG: DUF1080 domain-containing protein [Acidobacteria bacterium]|nr:DUF1080 domain-containing protein [Acidobacteriota bacterium]